MLHGASCPAEAGSEEAGIDPACGGGSPARPSAAARAVAEQRRQFGDPGEPARNSGLRLMALGMTLDVLASYLLLGEFGAG